MEPTMMTMAQGARETRTAATANSVTAAAGAAGDYLTNEEAYKMLRGANSGVKPELGHRLYRVVKRTVDILAAGGALVLLFIPGVILSVVICIKSPGASPLYSQWRVGRVRKDGTFYLFKIYKFRSMSMDSEKNGARLAAKGDKRVTPVGKIIRNIHFDELPQLFNILKGDMSMVGPRPERQVIADQYAEEIPEFVLRTKVKAGLTGYAQVYGKYNTTPYDKLKFDITYIENYSLWLDVKIMLLTFKILFQKENTEGVDETQQTALKD